MKKSSSLNEISKLFRRSPQGATLQAALELLPEAAFLVDCQHNIITLVNNKAIKLTAYTRQELNERSLHSICPNLNFSLFDLHEKSQNLGEVKLIQRSGSPIQVKAKINAVPGKKEWGILLMKQKNNNNQREPEGEVGKQRWHALQMLAKATQQATLDLAIKQILEAGQQLTGASTTALYSFQSPDKKLVLEISSGNRGAFLPDEILQTDQEQLRTPHLWNKGDHAQSLLERNAVAERVTYLATIPLCKKNDDIQYVLLVADHNSNPPTSLSESLKLMLQTLISSSQHFGLLTVLQKQVAEQDHLLSTNTAIKEIVNDGIIFVSPHLIILELNSQAEKTLGYQSAEVEGKHLDQILIGSESLMRVLQKAIHSEARQDLGDVRLHRRDGQLLLAHLRSIPIQVNQEVQRNAIFITDLSTHEAFRQRTKQLEQRALLGEVTAIFAHEVRNPVNNISTGLQVLKYQFEKENPVQEQIERLLQDCDRLTHLMSSTLSFSKSHEYKMESQNIKVLIENYLARMGSRLKQSNIELQTKFDQEIPSVFGDKRALEQVFSNIINNAIHIMQTQGGGTLGIKVEPNKTTGYKNHVNIDISDTGPGIPKETLERIFQPFFTTQEKGTGLGLTISQQIINAHSGQIKVDSFPGGTVFEIILPTAPLDK